MKEEKLHNAVLRQLEAISLAPEIPLIVSDADEVIFAFVQSLETFLIDNGYVLDLQSFALSGNIRNVASGEIASAEEVKILIAKFFEERTEQIKPVDGAAEALAFLSKRAQILVLSNVPIERRSARMRALVKNGMRYPLVANIGKKGAAMAYLASKQKGPIFFLDDIPSNIASVAKSAQEVINIHFVADHRLRKLIGAAEDADTRIDNWVEVCHFIEAQLNEMGL